jgi:hypothetical protein
MQPPAFDRNSIIGGAGMARGANKKGDVRNLRGPEVLPGNPGEPVIPMPAQTTGRRIKHEYGLSFAMYIPQFDMVGPIFLALYESTAFETASSTSNLHVLQHHYSLALEPSSLAALS